VCDEVRRYGDERAAAAAAEAAEIAAKIAKAQTQVDMINEIMEANHYTLEEALKGGFWHKCG
jgi:hypothetical protein